MKIIDFRLRPATPEFVAHLEWRAHNHPQGATSPVRLALARSLPPKELIAEMERESIALGVFTGRDWYGEDPDWPFTNESIARTVAEFPDKFVGFGAVDPRRPDPVAHVRSAVEELGLRGICLDAFALGTNASDERFHRIYEECQRLDVPIVITVGALPGIPVPMEASHPRYIDNIARQFPDLRILVSHAGWPFTQEILGVAFRHDNVWLENSFYHFAPGVESAMVQALNDWTPDRILFASAFPSVPLKGTIDALKAWPLSDAAKERFFFRNAIAFLGDSAPKALEVGS